MPTQKDIEDYEVAITFAQCGVKSEAKRIIRRMRKNCKHWYSKMFGSCKLPKKR